MKLREVEREVIEKEILARELLEEEVAPKLLGIVGASFKLGDQLLISCSLVSEGRRLHLAMQRGQSR